MHVRNTSDRYSWLELGILVRPVFTNFLLLACSLKNGTTRKKLINETFNASLKSYNDTSLKCHGLDCHCISLHTMTLISSVIFVNQNYDIHLKRHSLLIIFDYDTYLSVIDFYMFLF